MNAYDHHFVSVVYYAKLLAKKYGADEEIMETAAWLHDVGSILGDYKNHHVSGADYAGKFLKELKYPENKIKQVQGAILAHRGSVKVPKKTNEQKCLADADAMSHFNELGGLFYLALVARKLDTDKAIDFVKEKLERSYKKLSPRGKGIIKPKYKAAMLMLLPRKTI